MKVNPWFEPDPLKQGEVYKIFWSKEELLEYQIAQISSGLTSVDTLIVSSFVRSHLFCLSYDELKAKKSELKAMKITHPDLAKIISYTLDQIHINTGSN